MKFDKHNELDGLHAFLSPSSYSWLNYNEDKLVDRYVTTRAAQHGTRLHEFAKEAIELGIVLPDNGSTLNAYVNDAIKYEMQPEQVLYYSPNCFGTADAIFYRDGRLRIHDLKTGRGPTSEKQLEIYAALFCLEYTFNPFEMKYIELRIYQSDEVRVYEGDPDNIVHIMDKIISFDRKLNELHAEGY